jgi:cyanamide hydratase
VARDQSLFFTGIVPHKFPLTTEDIPVPQSHLIEVVSAFAQTQLSAEAFNNANRIFFWGMAIIWAAFPYLDVDKETFCITCLLHNIGLADAFRTTKMSFEVREPSQTAGFEMAN